ncbi:IclR family transcriptional regulator (plasmid) [Gemmobacter fulvus]|uniref:IclR family transcriptional regulator n=1 Tax=Gemmobacter fulvus TaxID=2840474 RepID=A0A975PB50_9RHOB|nr:IclR family transcriptional regulator [Gemmobacter fulvus]MBT9246246.1 IclR family transcriptional regulator [Gemmobacter fulvus]MDQ1850209.1 IclR family transcriptional regulator [Gemmobacter fulvus]QWK92398.1 IclR family transcriptional regulator [Gemmobacter fulvus]
MAAVEGVKAADLCLRILEYVAFEPEPAGVTQIAEFAGIAKSAAFKHLQTLIDHGFVVQDTATTRYRLGPKSWLLSRHAQSLDDIAAVALPLMLAARNALGVAVVLSAPTPQSAFVLSTVASNQQIEIGVKPGSQLSLHASAQGKVFLAFGAPELMQKLRQGPLPRITPRTITDPAALAAELPLIRQRGYATAPEQSLLGVNAIAAPVYNYDNTLIGSVGLIGSVQHILDDPQPELVARLCQLTADISAALGHRATG